MQKESPKLCTLLDSCTVEALLTAGPVSAVTCWASGLNTICGLTNEALGTSCNMSTVLEFLAEQLRSDWSLADLLLTTF